MTTPTHKKSTSSQPDTLPVLSIIFGLVSLMGPGLLLGVPAIILAGIALKKDLPNRGLSITGLVTGIISTVLSLILILFLGIILAWAVDHSETYYEDYYYPKYDEQPAYQGTRT